MAAVNRSLSRIIQLPPPARGQFGPNHTVVEVIRPDAWADQDPFILLMDDRLDGRLQAGPHPHAGFETVTFPLEGGMESEGGGGHLRVGDVEWTTAGSGIVHGPEKVIEGRFRLLQLWLTLPHRDRWTTPDNQIIPGDQVPVRREPGVEVRLYSGATGELVSPTRNRVPVTLVDVRLEPGARVEQALPTSYNGFLYVLDGEATVGADHAAAHAGRLARSAGGAGRWRARDRERGERADACAAVCGRAAERVDRFVRTVHRRVEGRHRAIDRALPGGDVPALLDRATSEVARHGRGSVRPRIGATSAASADAWAADAYAFTVTLKVAQRFSTMNPRILASLVDARVGDARADRRFEYEVVDPVQSGRGSNVSSSNGSSSRMMLIALASVRLSCPNKRPLGCVTNRGRSSARRIAPGAGSSRGSEPHAKLCTIASWRAAMSRPPIVM